MKRILKSVVSINVVLFCVTAYGDINQTKLVASDAASNDAFGKSVSVYNDQVAVGAFLEDARGQASGSVYVFERAGNGWTEEAKLVPSDGVTLDTFGRSVALESNMLIGGAPGRDDSGASSGAAYIFSRIGNFWQQEAKITPNDPAPGDEFGTSVDISGDTIIVGSPFDDDAGSRSGSAYVFVRDGNSWSQEAKLTADDGSIANDFGFSVALSGNTAIVGAHFHDASQISSGAAYIFVRNGNVWSQQAKLTASDAGFGDLFGFSVSVSGDTVVVGAFGDDNPTKSEGSAYVFSRNGTAWTQQAKLSAPDGAVEDFFGGSVSIDGDVIVIGAASDDDTGARSGSAYFYKYSMGFWDLQEKLSAEDSAAEDQFGGAVDISKNTAVVGASFNDDAGSGSGSAYVFSLTSDEVSSVFLVPIPKWSLAILVILSVVTCVSVANRFKR